MLVAIEDLSKREYDNVSALYEESGGRGVLVGAVRGSELQVIAQEFGARVIVRGLAPKARAVPELETMLMWQQARGRILAWGKRGVAYWVKRSLYKESLPERLAAGALDSTAREAIFLAVVGELLELRDHNLVHGHLCPENICFDDDKPIIVDHGYARWGIQRDLTASYAPEVGRAQEPTLATDRYGLGLIAAALGLLERAERLLQREPDKRPSLDAFEPSKPIDMFVPAPATERPVPVALVPQVEAPPVAPVARQSSVEQPKLSITSPTIFYALLFVLVGGAALGSSLFRGESQEDLPYSVYWASLDSELMQRVADAALSSRDPEAARVIIDDALRGGEREPRVRSHFLRLVFDKPWGQEISATDEEFALSYALTGLQKGAVAPALADDLHPAVLLGVAADRPYQGDDPYFASISIDKMLRLPAPWGIAFLELKKTGARTLAEPLARTLAHLMVGDFDDRTVRYFLVPQQERGQSQVEARLRILVLLMGRVARLDRITQRLLKAQDTLFPESLGWLRADDLVGWDQANARDYAALVARLMPPGRLTAEQYADLLTFPDQHVRERAAKRLSQDLAIPEPVVQLLLRKGTEQEGLTRLQTVSLVSALHATGGTIRQYLSQWFQLSPSPSLVAELVHAGAGEAAMDLFNLEAVRYLTKATWQVSPSALDGLTRHPDPLVRALAYSKLSPADDVQYEILYRALKREPKANLRDLVQRKFEGR